MAKLASQLKAKFFGLVACITSCGSGGHHKDAGAKETKLASVQHTEIRTRGGPNVSGGSNPHNHNNAI